MINEITFFLRLRLITIRVEKEDTIKTTRYDCYMT